MRLLNLKLPTLSITLFVLFFGLTTMMSCKKDKNDKTVELRYDTANIDAPLLPGASYEGAVRFPVTLVDQNAGALLTKVDFYIKNVPNSTEVKIYRGSVSGTAPDELVYSSVVTGNVSANSWNTHTLGTPLAVNGDDLWVSIAFSHAGDLQALGCDAGPAVANGDLILDPAQGFWRGLSSYTPVSINWNIRATVETAE